MRVALVTLLLAFSLATHGQTLELRAKTAPRLEYHLISQLSSGPAFDISDGKVRGKYLRLVVYEAELAYDPPTLRIEQFTYGDEGCCKTLRKASEVELDKVLSSSPCKYNPEKEGLTIAQWVGPTTVMITYQGTTFVLSELDKPVVKVKHADR